MAKFDYAAMKGDMILETTRTCEIYHKRRGYIYILDWIGFYKTSVPGNSFMQTMQMEEIMPCFP